MSTSLDKLIKLLAQNDGRDKIYKFLAGLFKILATISAQSASPDTKSYVSIGNSINSGRSLMRMGGFVADVAKMRSIGEVVSAQGFKNTEVKKFVEFFRTLGNALFILGDNTAFIARHRLITNVNEKAALRISKLGQFYGFLLAAILDLFNLRDAIRKLEYDPPASKRAAKNAVISFTKDMADVLVSMAAVNYLSSVWHPSGVTTGTLTLFSGGVATYLNWNKIK